jgi:hypothetical protein
LDSTHEGGFSVSKGGGTVSLFLFAATEFLPCAACFVLGDLELAVHFAKKVLGPDLVLFSSLRSCKCISAALSLSLQLTLQVCLHLLGSFLFRAGVEEPALELALG